MVDILLGNPIVQLFTFAVEGFFVAGFCIGGVVRGTTEYPQSHFAPIILGTIACVGGGILRPFFINQYMGESVENSVLSQPNFTLKAPILMSVFYYVTKFIYKMDTFDVPLSMIPLKETQNVVLQFTPEHVMKTYFVFHFLMIYFLSHPAFQKKPKAPPKKKEAEKKEEKKEEKKPEKKEEKKKETKKNK